MNDPFKIDSPTCISFSGGRTSAYMLWRVLQSNGGLPPEAVVAFANTGKEDEATLRFVRDCGQNWGVPITWVEYRNDEAGFAVVDYETASRDGEPFEALIRKRNYLPNPVARFCSMELKGMVITKVTGIDSGDTMVGVRADEPHRLSKLRERGLMLPLVDARITKADVRAFWRSSPFDLELEERNGITMLGNCDLCFLKHSSIIVSLIAEKPERAAWWAAQEGSITNAKITRGGTFRSDRPSYAAMLAFTQAQSDAFGYADDGIECVGCTD